MATDLAKLQKSFERVQALQPVIDQMIVENDDVLVCKDTNIRIRDVVRAYDELCTGLAKVVVERTANAPKLEEAMTAAVKVATEQATAQREIPEGALVVRPTSPKGDMNDATVLVLEGVSKELLTKLVKAAAQYLAGGTDDVLDVINKTTANTGQFGPGYSHGTKIKGYPKAGLAVVTKVGKGKVQKAAGGPETPEAPLAGLIRYLSMAALARGGSGPVYLKGPGLER
jgi:hypothetical protein